MNWKIDNHASPGNQEWPLVLRILRVSRYAVDVAWQFALIPTSHGGIGLPGPFAQCIEIEPKSASAKFEVVRLTENLSILSSLHYFFRECRSKRRHSFRILGHSTSQPNHSSPRVNFY